jgi:hypothetical protein
VSRWSRFTPGPFGSILLQPLAAAGRNVGEECTSEQSGCEDYAGCFHGFAPHRAFSVVYHVLGCVSAAFYSLDGGFESVFNGLRDGVLEPGYFTDDFVY